MFDAGWFPGTSSIKRLSWRKTGNGLEKGLPLKMDVLKALKDELTGIVDNHREWKTVLENIHDSGEYYCIHLLHPDNVRKGQANKSNEGFGCPT